MGSEMCIRDRESPGFVTSERGIVDTPSPSSSPSSWPLLAPSSSESFEARIDVQKLAVLPLPTNDLTSIPKAFNDL